MVLQKTGFTEDTSKKYLVDSATIYQGISFVNGQFQARALLGATDGGVEVKIDFKYRDVSIDGTYWTKVKGNKALSSAVATAKASLKELDVEAWRLAQNGDIRDALPTEAPTGYQVVTAKRYVEDSDYIDNIAVVGKISGTDEPIIIILDNCLCTSGVDAKTKDDDEAVIDLEFEAHATYDQLVADEFPWRIFYPSIDKGTVTGITLKASKTTGILVGDDIAYTATYTPNGLPVDGADLELVVVPSTAGTFTGNTLEITTAGAFTVIGTAHEGKYANILTGTATAPVLLTGITSNPTTLSGASGEKDTYTLASTGTGTATAPKLIYAPASPTTVPKLTDFTFTIPTADAGKATVDANGAITYGATKGTTSLTIQHKTLTNVKLTVSLTNTTP